MLTCPNCKRTLKEVPGTALLPSVEDQHGRPELRAWENHDPQGQDKGGSVKSLAGEFAVKSWMAKSWMAKPVTLAEESSRNIMAATGFEPVTKGL